MLVNAARDKNTLQITSLLFARQYIQDNFRYQIFNTMSHYARITVIYFQQQDITNMEQPVKPSNRNPIDRA